MPLGFGFRFGFGVGGSVASFIKWLLSNNLNLSATIGAAAVSGGTSVTNARVWDATAGLLIQEVSAGSPVSEGMRHTESLLEGSTELGSQLLTNNRFENWTGSSLDDWTLGFTPDESNYIEEVAGGVRIVGESGIVRVRQTPLTVGKWYKYRIEQTRSSGYISLFGGLTYTTLLLDNGVSEGEFLADSSSMWIRCFFDTAGTPCDVTIRQLDIWGIKDGFVNSVKDGHWTNTVAIGDSLTAPPASWIERISTRYQENAAIINSGVSGDLTSEMWARWQTDVLDHNPDAVIIWGGVNDARVKIPIATTTANLQNMIESAIANSIQPVIVTPPPYGQFFDYLASEQPFIDGYNAWIRQYAADNSIPMFDAYAAFVDSDGISQRVEVTQDGLHLASFGKQSVADGVGPLLPYIDTPLTPSKTGSNGEEIMLVFDAWSNGATVPAGGYLTDFDGVQNKYYSSVLGGTTSGTGVADDTGVTDWVEEGNYNNVGGLTHVLNEGAATNLFLNSDTPVTQNITTTAQNYTVSVWGTGSVTLSGTATGVATQGNPLTVTATAGTLTCTVAGSLSWGQVEAGDVNTTFTDGTRDATSFTSARVITEQFIRIRVADIQSQTYLSDGTNTLAYDLATTTLTFTDGTTTLTYVGALTVGDTIFIDQVDGKLYVEEDLKDTDGALDPLPWGAITAIGNVTDIYESSDLDPTDDTWDDPE